jgi:hypothetical protein
VDGIGSLLLISKIVFQSISRCFSLVSDGFFKDGSLAESIAGGFCSRLATVLTGTEILHLAYGSGCSLLLPAVSATDETAKGGALEASTNEHA